MNHERTESGMGAVVEEHAAWDPSIIFAFDRTAESIDRNTLPGVYSSGEQAEAMTIATEQPHMIEA